MTNQELPFSMDPRASDPPLEHRALASCLVDMKVFFREGEGARNEARAGLMSLAWGAAKLLTRSGRGLYASAPPAFADRQFRFSVQGFEGV